MWDWVSTPNIIFCLQLLYVVTALGVTIVIITENRNPVKTVSWILILVFLPIVGLIIFYFFGEDGRRKRLISHKIFGQLSKTAFKRIEPSKGIVPPSEHANLANLLTRIENSAIYEGNEITFYSDGKSKFDALFKEINNAKNYIHIQYYIFMNDEIGCKLRDLLISKAQSGVKVRFLYDDVGCWKVPRKFFKDMEREGIDTQAFLKVAFKFLTSRVNYRNHRKIVIIDGKVGFIGGMNVADRYINGPKNGIWRDNHFKIEGKAVAGLQTSFIVDWYYSRKEFLHDDIYFPKISKKGDNQIQFGTSGPMGRYKNIHLAVIQAIYDAQKYVYIQTPYFIPTELLLVAIQTAAIRGVDVRLMIPRHSDTTFVQIATLAFVQELLEANVSVYFFEAGFLHSKLMIIDDSLIVTGSANMDIRSFEHNFEIDAFIYNKESSIIARNIFERDMELSSLLTVDEWTSRSKFRKFLESVMRLFSPLL